MKRVYLTTIDLEDEGDGAEGPWVCCKWCDGSWRPDQPAEHLNDCPVEEVDELLRRLHEIRLLAQLDATEATSA